MEPSDNNSRLPIILVHGAANSSSVWKFWRQDLTTHGWPSYAINLRGHGDGDSTDLSYTSMSDYAEDVLSLIKEFKGLPVLIGWSMGGLIAMMAGAMGKVAACVTLAPSMPARRIDPSIELRIGEFTALEYGITSKDPGHQPAMPDLDLEERNIALASLSGESRLARDERRRGVVIEKLPCPLLIVTGTLDTQWPRQRYDNLWLKADHLSVEGASHWGLVLNRRSLAKTIPAVLQWLERATQPPVSSCPIMSPGGDSSRLSTKSESPP